MAKKISLARGLGIALALVSPIILLPTAEAATLTLVPGSGGFTAGQTFSVRVAVDSSDQAMNAVSGTVSFPVSLLEVVSISKTGSIVNLWVQEPSFSNEAGTVSFEGVVLNPGYAGANGTVITVVFRTKANGVANLRFTSGSVLANDGQGTNILASLGTGGYTIGGTTAGDVTSPTPPGAPLAPRIVSPTHPNPDRWYANKTPQFTWEVPSGVTAVRLLYNTSPLTTPTVLYDPPISEKKIEDVSDGAYYLHAQFRNANGWGAVAHFRFQVDTTPPERFEIRLAEGEDSTNPNPVVLFNTRDTESGIEYYKVKIGDQDFVVVSSEQVEHNPYTLPSTVGGTQTLLVQAFDRAGNYQAALSEVVIQQLPAPVITTYPSTLEPGGILTVRGRTVPNATVTVWLEREGITPRFYNGTSDAQGNYVVAGDREIPAGVYELWADAVDARGAKTAPSARYTVAVESPSIIRIGSYAINLLTVIVSIIALLVFLASICWFAWRNMFGFKKKVQRDIKDAERDVKKEFEKLRASMKKHLRLLESAKTKRALTIEEEKILIHLKHDVDAAETAVEEELEEIKKDLN